MDAISGKKRPAELFLPQNGLLIYDGLEKYFDAGKFVIVPDVTQLFRQARKKTMAWRCLLNYKLASVQICH
jgi:hypothetical protein